MHLGCEHHLRAISSLSVTVVSIEISPYLTKYLDVGELYEILDSKDADIFNLKLQSSGFRYNVLCQEPNGFWVFIIHS